jgi:UDP-N-acetylglucosamine 4-epimerase
MKIIGLRYFNVFGPRQDPDGQYAAVIPRWINAVKNGEAVNVFGDGTTSRDFCYIENVVQANILSALSDLKSNFEVLNIALNGNTSLNDLIKEILINFGKTKETYNVKYDAFRKGDIYRSCANIDKAKKLINYSPVVYI